MPHAGSVAAAEKWLTMLAAPFGSMTTYIEGHDTKS